MCVALFSFLIPVCFLLEARLAPPPVQVALRFAGDTLERRHGDSLTAQALLLLRCCDRSSIERNLSRVREELFKDGVNWGRIVAMMELGGALSVEVARTGRLGQVDDIARWLEESLDSLQLQGWIEDNGGWVGRLVPHLISFQGFLRLNGSQMSLKGSLSIHGANPRIRGCQRSPRPLCVWVPGDLR